MAKRFRKRSSSFDQPTPNIMDKSDSNLSTPNEPAKPKKKRGRPPGSIQKAHLHKKQKAAGSSPPTLGNGRPLTDAHSEPLNPHTRLLQGLVDVFQKLVAVLESMNKNGKGDEEDGVTTPVLVPDYVLGARQRAQRLKDCGPNPIDLTSSNENPLPQQILDEVGAPESVNSAKRADSEELKKTTQLFERRIRDLMSTPAIPTGEKEKQSSSGVEEGREAVEKDYPKSVYLRAALQALDEGRVGSSLRSEGARVSPQ